MTTPLVSIITPTHDRAYCIEATIDSALAQTCGDLEILVIDDGSTDGTGEIVARRYGREGRVRYVRQENRGVSAARNHGHRLARGEYLAYLDSDDRWLPWKLALQLACFDRLPELGMMFTDFDTSDEQGQIVRRSAVRSLFGSYDHLDAGRPFTTTIPLREIASDLTGAVGDAVLHAGDAFSQMIVGNLVRTSTAMIRRSVAARVGPFDERVSHGEDYQYFLRASREAPAGFADVATTVYRVGEPDQLTNDPLFKLRMALTCLSTLERAIAGDRARIQLPAGMLRSKLADAHAWVAYESALAGQSRQALRHLAQSLRCATREWPFGRVLALALLPDPVKRAVRRIVRGARALRRA